MVGRVWVGWGARADVVSGTAGGEGVCGRLGGRSGLEDAGG